MGSPFLNRRIGEMLSSLYKLDEKIYIYLTTCPDKVKEFLRVCELKGITALIGELFELHKLRLSFQRSLLQHGESSIDLLYYINWLNSLSSIVMMNESYADYICTEKLDQIRSLQQFKNYRDTCLGILPQDDSFLSSTSHFEVLEAEIRNPTWSMVDYGGLVPRGFKNSKEYKVPKKLIDFWVEDAIREKDDILRSKRRKKFHRFWK